MRSVRRRSGFHATRSGFGKYLATFGDQSASPQRASRSGGIESRPGSERLLFDAGRRVRLYGRIAAA
jgi:hypothetical protein